ncbi:hypothetical protein HFP89_04480 [Wenzhouxiangella sp. XN79A]|uniref:hypothetical protein n=1 Tax=Wenzhouxiangella sp. XN79A TaxID=2724193 RepID=UPI00144AE1CB|nr:hypothetical protein [Wenzhouxiangella sp. XN79A]NKI34417.1 hypothetical protein [Wenzhouxiangella sp. XN79A]
MTDLLRFQAHHVSDKDIRVLRSLVGLAGNQTDLRVTISEDDEGDILLIDVDDAEGRAAWEAFNRGPVPAVALSKQRDFPARFLLTKPIRSQPLIQLLGELTSPSHSPEVEARTAPAWAVMAFGDDELPLAEHLRRHTWDAPVVLASDGGAELIIDAGSGAWYSGASDRELARLLQRSFAASTVRELSSSELIDHTNGLEQNNLTHLKWRAGLALSDGALHPDLAGDVRLMLPQVPLQALSDTAYSRQARLLIRAPMTVDELAEASRAEKDDVAAFLNACHACGFLLIDAGRPASASG